MTETTLLGRMLWYELLTTDLKAAEAFYSAVVGWGVKPFEGSPMPYDLWTRTDGTPVAGVMSIPDGMEFPPHWEMYVGVDRLEDTVAHVERLGGTALSPVIDIPTVGRMRTMQDPQGAVFALIEPASAERSPDVEPQEGDVAWRELFTTDSEAAMTFYTDVFGWANTLNHDMGAMGLYRMFGRAFPLGGMMNKPAQMAQVPPHWGLYFRVADVDAAAVRVKAHGGQVANGPLDVPGGARVVNCLDPQGAFFSLHQLPPAQADPR